MTKRSLSNVAAALLLLAWSSAGLAQDEGAVDGDAEGTAGPEGGEESAAEGEASDGQAADEPSEAAGEAPGESETAEETSAGGDASLSLSAGAALGADSTSASADASGDASVAGNSAAGVDIVGAPAAGPEPVINGSHIRRPMLRVDNSLVLTGPLSTSVRQGEEARTRQTLGGIPIDAIAFPDTFMALGHGAPGVTRFALRGQPTLILLNGRRLVAAPYFGGGGNGVGSDVIDMNQIPLRLVERVETTRGMNAGLYGDGAIDGVINYVTHRDYEGMEVQLGGAITDKLDQHEGEITATVGMGSDKSGMNAMVSYFNRQPLGADERDWVKDREQRLVTLQGNPASYQPLLNFEYPFPDPACDQATQLGAASDLQVRLPLFGETVTRAGGPALDLLPTEPFDYQMRFLNNFDSARGDGDGVLEAYETATYCTGNFTSTQDLVIKDERIQGYMTMWHELSDHTEAFAELGYYRSDNENRTAPSFPISRLTADPAVREGVVVTEQHADIPVRRFGFAIQENTPTPESRFPNSHFIVGRAVGLHAGANKHERSVDVMRGVLGLKGDLKDAGSGSIMETWDWEVSGVHSVSRMTSRVPDTLLDKLGAALSSCPLTVEDTDTSSPTYRQQVPSTIKQRQELGCYNPFYSSVLNNAAIDPLNLSSASAPADGRGFITSDTEAGMHEADGVELQDGGYICDPNDPNSPPCPAELDADGDGVFEFAGTPNTQQVIDSLTGEHTREDRRSLTTADAIVRGDLAEFTDGSLSFAAGGQVRRESLRVDYDSSYNQRLYAFLAGAPDVPDVDRHIGVGFGELRLSVAKGLLEVQPALRIEHYENVGTALNAQAGVAVRPFVDGSEALEWLLVRGHVGRGNRAPSLVQMYGTLVEFNGAEFDDALQFVPHQISGNRNLDFEKYLTFSGGLQWDYDGFHVGGDFWMTQIDDLIGADNVQTLLKDCERQFAAESTRCPEVTLLATGGLNEVRTNFDNLAAVDTNGVDGGISYTLDTKRKDMGELGTFMVGVQGRFINSYLIKSPRALRELYRPDPASRPVASADGKTRDYSGLSAEYEAAGYRNLENFAPPMPRLRMGVPVRWFYEGHTLGLTARYIGSYNDDSEATIERYGLATTLAAGETAGTVPDAEGEQISDWTVFDLNYGYSFGEEGWKMRLALGVINLFDADPPAAESPLGYDVGIHDPRGRVIYARVTGDF
ncbi:MAG: TonB-dependent receptor [Myxococcales bacterium]|nr:TonB-dependent receptor [Myxococcales bacterium]